MAFREIDDDIWEIVQKYIPPTKPHIGRPRCDPRGLINGILYVLTTGCSWLDVPAKYGTKSTVHRYHLIGRGIVPLRFWIPPLPSRSNRMRWSGGKSPRQAALGRQLIEREAAGGWQPPGPPLIAIGAKMENLSGLPFHHLSGQSCVGSGSTSPWPGEAHPSGTGVREPAAYHSALNSPMIRCIHSGTETPSRGKDSPT
ncbi:transposase [Methanofollis tationis]|uniref:Transposase n=1 Tax=Methanofollis tationis TaxID=81417 RepID=A0A7K4HNL5_9EURY|nr:transposase [Methanofollis tationis]